MLSQLWSIRGLVPPDLPLVWPWPVVLPEYQAASGTVGLGDVVASTVAL